MMRGFLGFEILLVMMGVIWLWFTTVGVFIIVVVVFNEFDYVKLTVAFIIFILYMVTIKVGAN